jgi:hypothetical protein
LNIGTVASDDKINDTEDESSVSISGTSTGAEGQSVSLSVAGGAAKTALVAVGGAWSVSLTSAEAKALTEGNVSLTANVSDAAGNAATQASKTVVYDKTIPTLSTLTRATLSGPTGSSTFTIDAVYADTGMDLDSSSITTGDITVTGPGAVGALTVSGASYASGTHTATYTVNAPGGGWSAASHAGNYTVALAAGEVKDLAGNAVVANASAHSFAVSFNTAPTVTSNGGATASIDQPEMTTTVTTVVASDADAGDTLTYSITGGADQAQFSLDAGTHILSFASAPNFDTPTDSDADNLYLVEVTANDGHGGTDMQAITVTVLSDIDRDGTPDITDTDDDNDGRLDSIEDPVPNAHGAGTGDGNGDGILDREQINVASLGTVGTAAAGKRFATIEVADGLTLSNVANSAAPAGLPRSAKMPLGQFDFDIGNVTPGGTVSVSMYVDKTLGMNGYYKLNGSTWTNIGTLSTVDNKTKITFSLTDGGIYDADGIVNGIIKDPGGAVLITPLITSNGGETTAALAVAENSTAVTTVSATVPPALAGVTYSITGGTDQAKFMIDASSGALAFASAPSFGVPTDADSNNTYVVDVTASDTNGGTDVQTLTVSVTASGGGGEPPAPTPAPEPTPAPTPTDSDGDGISNSTEDGVPSLPPTDGGAAVPGDGNGDGVADKTQDDVTSLPFLYTETAISNPGSAPKIYVTLVADSNEGQIDTTDGNTAVLTQFKQKDAPADKPADIDMPLGQISFEATVGAPGVTETFSLLIDGDIPINGYYKQSSSGAWVNIATAVVTENGKTRLDFAITDGGEFDSNPAPGVIGDPGAPAYRINMVSTESDDLLYGGTGSDSILGRGGNDTISGAAGNDTIDGGSGSDIAVFSGNLADYKLSKSGSTYTVQAKTGSDGTDTLTNIESLQFADKTVNLTIQAKAATISPTDLQHLSELYIGFFNRIPEAEGLALWIDHLKAGQSFEQIGESFYQWGVYYSSLTGYTANMSNADFVNLIYRDTLGRKEGADAGGLACWTGALASGQSHGTVVSNILKAAHSYKGDATYGWVADLLDNKALVVQTVAVDWGVGYASPEQSITQGKAIAAAVTTTDTTAAIALVGISAVDMGV